MLRLLIIDDEPIIADGLHETLSAHYSSALEVMSVYSAKEALRLFERARIDIMISDIVMPKMDGLQLMNEVQSQWPSCRVIFLTGHGKFDFAYDAIAGGVSAFILKTEPDEKIIAAVDGCIEEIESESDNEEFLLRVQAELDENRNLIQRENVARFLRGMTPLEVFLSQVKEGGIPVKSGYPCLLVCGKFSAKQEIESYTALQARIKTLFDLYLHSLGSSYLFFDSNDTELFAILQPKMSKRYTANIISDALESLQTAFHSHTRVDVSFIVDDEAVDLSQLPARYAELSSFLRYWMENEFFPQLLQASHFSEMLDPGSLVELGSREVIAKVINRARQALEDNSEEAYREALLQVKRMLVEADNHPLFRLDLLTPLISDLSSFIRRRQLQSQIPAATCQVLCSLFSKTPDEVYQSLQVLGEVIFSTAASIKYSRDYAFVQRIQKYIIDHMAESITLLQVGEYMHYNPAYMSRKYKGITGENLSEAIIQIKLTHAQEMIRREPHRKIREVAEMTGFQYPAYFAQVFKKHFEISPQEFRDLVS